VERLWASLIIWAWFTPITLGLWSFLKTKPFGRVVFVVTAFVTFCFVLFLLSPERPPLATNPTEDSGPPLTINKPLEESGPLLARPPPPPLPPGPPATPPVTAAEDARRAAEVKAPAKEAEVRKQAEIRKQEEELRRALNQLAERRRVLELLPLGDIVLHAPAIMNVGEERNVEASVGLNVPIEELRKPPAQRDQAIEAKGVTRISSEMIATLNGAGFTIKAVTPEQQSVAEGFPTVWSWNVKADQDGEQSLVATLYVLMPDGDKSARQLVKSYTRTISVSVTWGKWFELIGHQVDAAKAIGVTLGCITLALGWFGISLHRRSTKKRSSSSARSRGEGSHKRKVVT
jgi:hypothetical protein